MGRPGPVGDLHPHSSSIGYEIAAQQFALAGDKAVDPERVSVWLAVPLNGSAGYSNAP